MTKENKQADSKSLSANDTNKAGLMPFEDIGIIPLAMFSQGKIFTDNALGLNNHNKITGKSK